MALTPAERQRIRRQKLKEQGTTRRDWVLEPEELRMLSEICTQRRPGREPYSENRPPDPQELQRASKDAVWNM